MLPFFYYNTDLLSSKIARPSSSPRPFLVARASPVVSRIYFYLSTLSILDEAVFLEMVNSFLHYNDNNNNNDNIAPGQHEKTQTNDT